MGGVAAQGADSPPTRQNTYKINIIKKDIQRIPPRWEAKYRGSMFDSEKILY